MKTFTMTLLGSAIAALLSAPALAAPTVAKPMDVSPPLLPGLHKQDLQQPTDRFIVKFRDAGVAKSQRESALARVATHWGTKAAIPRRLAIGADIVKLGRRLDRVEADAFLAQLRADPSVEYAHVDRRLRADFIPNDPYYPVNQWHYYESVGGLRLESAWNLSKGSGVVVAVLDTGVAAHPDLDANILPGYDFILDDATGNDANPGRDADASDPGDWVEEDECGSNDASDSSWHGTHVSGTVAALTNNGAGVAGVAHLGKVVPVRVLGKCGGYTSDIADAIVWAAGGTVDDAPANANPAEVINMSLGGDGSCDPTSQAAIDYAYAAGTVVVVAAGNSNGSNRDHSPASCNNVISVASNDQDGTRSGFSNSGVGIDVAAPGGAPYIASTANSGATVPASPNYLGYQGTSMAAPHVAGVVALMQSLEVFTPAEIESMLKITALPLLGAACPGGCGAGKVDGFKAVNFANGTLYSAKPTTMRNGVAIDIDGALGSNARFQLVTFSDLANLSFDLSGGTGNPDLYVKLGAAPTTTDYDCRSNGLTSTESCVIPSAANGVYHVLVRGKTAFSDVAVRGKYNTSLFTNKEDLPVNDNSATHVQSRIKVFGHSGNAPSDLKVSVALYHRSVGQLEFDLVAPDGSIYPLQAASGDTADNLVTSYYVDASSELANGDWKLRLRDQVAAEAGHLDQWTLRL